MQGWAAEAAAMLLLPTCLLALIGVFIATCVLRTNCSAFFENGSAAMQENNSIIHQRHALFPSNVRASVTESRYCRSLSLYQ